MFFFSSGRTTKKFFFFVAFLRQYQKGIFILFFIIVQTRALFTRFCVAWPNLPPPHTIRVKYRLCIHCFLAVFDFCLLLTGCIAVLYIFGIHGQFVIVLQIVLSLFSFFLSFLLVLQSETGYCYFSLSLLFLIE